MGYNKSRMGGTLWHTDCRTIRNIRTYRDDRTSEYPKPSPPSLETAAGCVSRRTVRGIPRQPPPSRPHVPLRRCMPARKNSTSNKPAANHRHPVASSNLQRSERKSSHEHRHRVLHGSFGQMEGKSAPEARPAPRSRRNGQNHSPA